MRQHISPFGEPNIPHQWVNIPLPMRQHKHSPPMSQHIPHHWANTYCMYCTVYLHIWAINESQHDSTNALPYAHQWATILMPTREPPRPQQWDTTSATNKPPHLLPLLISHHQHRWSATSPSCGTETLDIKQNIYYIYEPTYPDKRATRFPQMSQHMSTNEPQHPPPINQNISTDELKYLQPPHTGSPHTCMNNL
jgi:hypothetical protein